jgi:hypothetical protein
MKFLRAGTQVAGFVFGDVKGVAVSIQLEA